MQSNFIEIFIQIRDIRQHVITIHIVYIVQHNYTRAYFL